MCMKIAIDAVAANNKIRTGVGEYAFQILSHMMKTTSSSEEVVLYTSEPLNDNWPELPGNWKNVVLKWKLPGWSMFRLNFELVRSKSDVVFCPGSKVPFFAPSRKSKNRASVTTIHDVGFARIPEHYSGSDLRGQKSGIKRAIKKCAHLLSVSEFTKKELVDIYKINERRVTVSHLGIENVLNDISKNEIELVRSKYHLSKHYFLFVSRLDSKKNVENLISAFTIFKQSKGFGDPHELVLVGPDGFSAQRIKSLAKSSIAKDSIDILGAVSDEEKKALYAGALGYINVSWYEGFGLTPLEAASFKVPAIMSDVPAHREVMGNGAVYVSPKAASEIASVIDKFADNASYREEILVKAQERLGMFDWNKTADITWEVLRGVRAPDNLFNTSV